MNLSITYLLIGINAIAFIYLQNHIDVATRWMLIPERIRRNREYDRMLLSGFAHLDLLHIIFNMLTLYYFGTAIEGALGSMLFFIIYIGSILSGSLFCMFMRSHDHGYAALGASGGVLGLIYALIMMSPESSLSIFFLPIPIPGWLFGIIFTILSILLSQNRKAEQARISHEGHLGGAAFGGIFVLVLMQIMGADFNMRQMWFIIGGILPIAGFALVKLVKPGLLYRHH